MCSITRANIFPWRGTAQLFARAGPRAGPVIVQAGSVGRPAGRLAAGKRPESGGSRHQSDLAGRPTVLLPTVKGPHAKSLAGLAREHMKILPALLRGRGRHRGRRRGAQAGRKLDRALSITPTPNRLRCPSPSRPRRLKNLIPTGRCPDHIPESQRFEEWPFSGRIDLAQAWRIWTRCSSSPNGSAAISGLAMVGHVEDDRRRDRGNGLVHRRPPTGFHRDVPLLCRAGLEDFVRRTSFPSLQAPQACFGATTKGDDRCANISACRARGRNRFFSGDPWGAHRDKCRQAQGPWVGLTLFVFVLLNTALSGALTYLLPRDSAAGRHPPKRLFLEEATCPIATTTRTAARAKIQDKAWPEGRGFLRAPSPKPLATRRSCDSSDWPRRWRGRQGQHSRQARIPQSGLPSVKDRIGRRHGLKTWRPPG